jgi:hypothetical protein
MKIEEYRFAAGARVLDVLLIERRGGERCGREGKDENEWAHRKRLYPSS